MRLRKLRVPPAQLGIVPSAYDADEGRFRPLDGVTDVLEPDTRRPPHWARSPPFPDSDVTVAVDSARKELTITAGPYLLPNMPPMEEHAMMHHGMADDTPIGAVRLAAGRVGPRLPHRAGRRPGTRVPRHVLHHLIMVNFSRRQLIYPAAERLMGAGSETEDVTVPKTVGVPLTSGHAPRDVRRLAQRYRQGPG